MVQQTIRETKVIQEVVLSGVSKLNHATLNKKQGDQMRSSPQKRPEKKKMDSQTLVNSLYRWMDCVRMVSYLP